MSHTERKRDVKRPQALCTLNVMERDFRLIPLKLSPQLGVLSENNISFTISPNYVNHFKTCLFPIRLFEKFMTLKIYTN